tara:strand:+ start:3550 stop:3987 length:438 start_codon:yes stop_codon:yes gene_type:complete
MSGYIDQWRSPSGARNLLGTVAAPVTLGTSYTGGSTSSPVTLGGHKYFTVFVQCTALGGAGRLDLQFEVAASSGSSDWSPLQTESVSSGASTQSDYEIKKAVSGTGQALAVSIPIRGFRYWRIKMKSDAGTPQVYVRYFGSGGPV